MDASISTATINEKNSNANKQGSSDSVTSIATSLASTSISSEHRSTSQGRRRIKTTTFDKVFIYEFPLTLGDNPAVREGCPVALGNKCVNQTVLDVESFEESRRPDINKRRRGKDLYIPVYDRAALLMSQGFTLEKIVQTVLEVEEVKKSRQECLKLNGWQKLNYAIDSAGKSIIRKFTSGNKWNNDKNNDDNTKGGNDRKRESVVPTARMA